MKITRNLKAFLIVMALIASSLTLVVVVAGLPRRTLARTAVPHTEGVTSYESRVASSIVIDHNAVDADAIPQDWLDQARVLSIFFTHKSIGENILDGLRDLAAQNPTRYSITIRYSDGTQPGLNEYQVGSNGQPTSKIDGFAQHINPDHDAAMMKFCVADAQCVGGDTDINVVWQRYRDMMSQQPNGVWWTWPLVASNNSRAESCNSEIARFNDQVRAYVLTNGGILFDLADIESHDPQGNPVRTAGGYEAAWPDYTSDGAHLNEAGRQRVARALWWLLARVAGWTEASGWISVTAVTDVASVHQGETATYALAVAASEGFATPVTLSLQDPPGGTSVAFEPNPVTPPGNSQLYVTTTLATVAGTYPMTVTGTAGALSDTAHVTLIVASAAPSFTLGISPTTLTAAPNQTVSYTVAVTGINGFSRPVTLATVGLPPGVGAGWSINPVTPGGSSALTLSIPSSLLFGEYFFYVVGMAETQVVARGIELIIDYPFKAWLPIILK